MCNQIGLPRVGEVDIEYKLSKPAPEIDRVSFSFEIELFLHARFRGARSFSEVRPDIIDS